MSPVEEYWPAHMAGPDVDLTGSHEYRPVFPKVEGEEVVGLTFRRVPFGPLAAHGRPGAGGVGSVKEYWPPHIARPDVDLTGSESASLHAAGHWHFMPIWASPMAFSPLRWVKDFIKMLEGKAGELLGNIEKNAVTVMKRLWGRTSTGELAQEGGVSWFDVLMDIISLLLGMPPSSVFGALAHNEQLKHLAFKEFIVRLAEQIRHDVDMLISKAAEDGHEIPEEVALKLVLLAYKRGIEKARSS